MTFFINQNVIMFDNLKIYKIWIFENLIFEYSKMPNKWIEALKEHNKGSNKFCVPKKGTPEYDNIIKTMNKPKEYYQMPEAELEKLQAITRKRVTVKDKLQATQKWYDEGKKESAPYSTGQNNYAARIIERNKTPKQKRDEKKAEENNRIAMKKSLEDDRKKWAKLEKENPEAAKKEADRQAILDASYKRSRKKRLQIMK